MIALIIMVAVVLEALVEYIKTIMKMIEDGDYKTAITQGVTIALGIILAFTFHLKLFNEAYDLDIDPVIDTIITGILFSRGSNYFSDLIKKLTPSPDITVMYGDGTDMESFLNGEIAQEEEENG